jgi:hypothetical protein
MGALVTAKLTYLASIESAEAALAAGARVPAGTGLLLGEYGAIDPLAVFGSIRKSFDGPILLEILAKNKNRDLIRTSLISSAACGFDGALLASGLFGAGAGMAKPVYDLDPAQMLRLALDLKKDGMLPSSFTIAVRSAAGEGPAERRARFYLDEGADYIALEGAAPAVFDRQTLFIEPVA